MRLSGRVWGRRPRGRGLFESWGGKSMLWDAQQKGFGNGAVRGYRIPDFPHQWSGTSPSTEGNASWEFLWVRSVLPWGGAPQASTFPPYAYDLSLPPLEPGPSRLVTVPASHLEMAHWRDEVILAISDHWLEEVCSAVLWQVMSIRYFYSALRPERDLAAGDLRWENGY